MTCTSSVKPVEGRFGSVGRVVIGPRVATSINLVRPDEAAPPSMQRFCRPA
jgi:hypothetical protein